MSRIILSATDYSKMLTDFINTGEVWGYDGNPLSDYLVATMDNPYMKLLALRDDVSGRVFYDCMMRFVILNLNRSKMAFNRSQSEMDASYQAADWTPKRKRDGWQALVQMISEKHPSDFDAELYIRSFSKNDEAATNEKLWQQMVLDWQKAIGKEVSRQSLEHMKDDMAHAVKITKNNLEAIPEYISRTGIDNSEFLQAWNMMEGTWNEHLFSEVVKTVKLQRQYPVLDIVARKMGRYPDDNGVDTMKVGYGGGISLNHSSRSDIMGVTNGNNITDAFPMEIAMCGDESLDALFMRKYLSNRLQVFDSRSESLNPARKVHTLKARRKGPMIVCLDTSGSMQGRPMEVAKSLLLKLLDIAERENRSCYLILFSVSIVTYDLVKDRIKAIDSLMHYNSGGTNSTKMMEETFRLLNGGSEYCYGDVLWMSDFRIPMPDSALLTEMNEHQRAGTCFYGLQIGMAPQSWSPYFSEFYNEGYVPKRA